MNQKKNKSILMIGPFPQPITGMSLANKVLYESLIKSGHRVKKINTSLYSFDENVGVFSFRKLIYFLKFNFFLYKILRAKIIYLTPGHTFFGITKYSLFFIVSSLFNRKLILHIHSNTLKYKYQKASRWKQNVMKFLLKKATDGIVLSPSLRDNLTPFLPKQRIFTVKNFVEEKFISEERIIKEKQTDKLRIVFLSNLMTQKGIFFLIEALNILNENKINFEARLAGYIDANIKEKIKMKLSDLSNVNYLGVVTGIEKKNLLEWGNTFVFPSYLTEGLPISVLEAIATGNIIISTRHPALLDFFSEESITYIEKKSSISIAEALTTSLISRKLENKVDIYKYVTYNFTQEKFTNSIIKIMFVND